MKNLILTLFVLVLISTNSYSQLVVNANVTPNNLVHNVLIGNGVAASNVTYTGDLVAIGSFSNGMTTNLGLGSGILLTSGKASLAVGPNSAGGTGFDNTGGSDPQLASLITTSVNDAAMLEFDFVPLSDTLKFRYVFGSDEYAEFAGSNYNDVFGFFISGPNPAGGVYTNYNVAIVPGTTSTPVSINNVNNGPQNTGPCINCNYYIDNSSGLFLEYDAITSVLTAFVVVVPCQQYHFKFAIGDGYDGIYDSGVFLEANSFSTDAVQINTAFTVPTAIKKGIEGCNFMKLEAALYKPQNTDYIVHIDTMWGTATNGVDFPWIADSIVIPTGQLKGSLSIEPYADGITEPTEDIHMVIQTSICTVDTIVFPILDYDTIVISNMVMDTSICSDSANLWVQPSFGRPPYVIDWTPAASVANPNQSNTVVLPTTTTTYLVNVMDSTGCPAASDSVTVTVNPKPSLSFTGNPFSGCEPLTVSLSDMSTPTISSWLWDFGDNTQSTVQNPTHTYAAGVYDLTLNVETDDGCRGKLTIPSLINSYPKPNSAFEAVPPITTVDNPNFAFINHTTSAINYEWQFGNGTFSSITSPTVTYDPINGEYVVILIATSDKGCVDSSFQIVKVVVDEITVYNIITPNGDGQNDHFHIDNIEMIESSFLHIYNRWGRKIYESKNYKNDWDGDNAPDGVYFFTLDYSTYFRDDQISGTITILRK